MTSVQQYNNNLRTAAATTTTTLASMGEMVWPSEEFAGCKDLNVPDCYVITGMHRFQGVHSLQLLLIIVDPRYKTCFMSPFWCLEFWVGTVFLVNFCSLVLYILVIPCLYPISFFLIKNDFIRALCQLGVMVDQNQILQTPYCRSSIANNSIYWITGSSLEHTQRLG
jgi:hypothetical protein